LVTLCRCFRCLFGCYLFPLNETRATEPFDKKNLLAAAAVQPCFGGVADPPLSVELPDPLHQAVHGGVLLGVLQHHDRAAAGVAISCMTTPKL
jgi:hypothetical protein